MVIGANPTDGHPVFGSRMKRRVREGAKLIVVDPRRIDIVDTPHVKASHHLQLRPGTNVAIVNALAHVIVTEGLLNEAFIAERCETRAFEQWRDVRRAAGKLRPKRRTEITGVPAAPGPRSRAHLSRPAATPRSTTAWASPSTRKARRW